jgi:hypothetical protein
MRFAEWVYVDPTVIECWLAYPDTNKNGEAKKPREHDDAFYVL